MTADRVGGVWQYATTLAQGLAPLGYEVLLAVLGPGPDAAPAGLRIIASGLPLDWVGSDEAATRSCAERLAAIATAERCDLIHLNSPVLAAAARWPAPVLAMAHGCVSTWWTAARDHPLDAAFAWHREMTAAGLAAADLAAAPSAGYATLLRETYSLTRPIAVVHNGRDMQAPGDLPIAAHAFTAGRLWDEAKGAAVLDAAAACLAHPLRAAGALAGPNGERFVPGHLDALGALDAAAMAAELAARPVFVSAATFEPFGLAVLEAAQAGCALVLSDIATFRELWDGAATFVSAQDQAAAPAAYAAAIERLLAHPAERARLGELARARGARYTATAMAAGTARLYDRLLEDRLLGERLLGTQRAAAA